MSYEEYLWSKYKRTALSVEELINEFPPGSGITKRIIENRVRSCSSDIPEFVRVGRKTVFPIKAVAKFLENTVKVA